MSCRLLTVLVPSVVAQPDVVTLIDECERETSLFFRQADPDLTIHEQSMVEVDNRFPGRVWPRVDPNPCVLLSLPVWQSVYTQ